MVSDKFFTLWISLVCIVVFTIQFLFPPIINYFFLSENALSMPWQFFTAIFLHGSIVHLLYNLFALLLFGLILEHNIGSKRFLLFFLLSGIFANVISFFWYPNALGASGAIMAIMGCLAVLRPMMVVWAFNLPMPMFVLALFWIGGSIFGIFGFGDQGTGHLAHLSGIAIGISYGVFLRLKYLKAKPNFNSSRRIIIPENSMRRWEDYNLRR